MLTTYTFHVPVDLATPYHSKFGQLTQYLFTHPHVPLILGVGECHVAQLKVPLPVLQCIGNSCPRASLPQPTFTEDQMMDVATVTHTFLCCNCVVG